MKIRIISNPITPYGPFSRGDILTDDKYPEAFLHHLVTAAGAAEYINYETKIDPEYETEKKPLAVPETKPDTSQSSEALSSQSLPPAPASQKKTRGPYKKKPK